MCQIAVASGKCCSSSEAGSYSSAYVLGFVCTDVMNQMLVWYLAIGMMPVGIFYQRKLFSYK